MMSLLKIPVRLMELPLVLLMILEWQGRTGANRAEDWSARPSQERESHRC